MRSAERAGRSGAVAAVVIALLSVGGSGLLGVAHARAVAPAVHPAGPVQWNASMGALKIHDGSTLKTLAGSVTAVLTDSVIASQTAATSRQRTYAVTLASAVSLPAIPIALSTQPLNDWSSPSQLPDGVDNLPPLPMWSWTVYTGGGANDTANWTWNSTTATLTRMTNWTSQSYTVNGWCNETVNITVLPGTLDGSKATGGGYVVNAGGYPNFVPQVSGYGSMAASLHPSLVRIALTMTPTFTSWNKSSNQPVYHFASFDSVFNFANQTHAPVLISLPAGTWGDGNNAPTGTPLYTNTTVTLHSLSGHFVTRSAMYAMLRQLINHTTASGESVAYWGIGNEVPLDSVASSLLYAKVLSGAAQAVSAANSSSLIGTDTAMNATYIPIVAAHATGVGFLAFHYYPASGMCITNGGAYCPPAGTPGRGTTTPTLFSLPSYGRSTKVLAPQAAQQAWYNGSGNWIPTMNVETNVNSYGGGPLTWANGTDPRINDLQGAAWLGSLLVDSSEQDVAAIAYFSLTSNANISTTTSGPYGGFGFGMTNVTPAGRITCFAPYFVMQLWDRYIPAGASGVLVGSSDPASVEAYGVVVGGQVHLAVVDRVGIPVNIHVVLTGHFQAGPALTLTTSSYFEAFNATSGLTNVVRAGVGSVVLGPGNTLAMPGYGFALLQFLPIGM